MVRGYQTSRGALRPRPWELLTVTLPSSVHLVESKEGAALASGPQLDPGAGSPGWGEP